MLIGFILTVWMVWAALFCLGLCAAAARPIPPQDVTTRSDNEINPISICKKYT
jgi:hypothetical protein